MPTAPSAFPLLGAPQAPGDQPPEGGNSLGGRPPEAVGKIQLSRHTQPDPRCSQHGRPKWDPTTESAKCCGICSTPQRTWKCGTRTFFGGSGRRAVAHTRPAFPKNAYGPVGISLIRSARRSTPPKGVIAWGKAPWGRRKNPAIETHPARSAPQPAWPAEVKSDNWISKMLLFSTSNLVFFIFIKSRHFTEAYLVLLHKTSHTSCILFFFWFPRAGSRESTFSVSSR